MPWGLNDTFPVSPAGYKKKQDEAYLERYVPSEMLEGDW